MLSDIVTQFERSIGQHPGGSTTRIGDDEHARVTSWNGRAGRRAKRFLSPSQKYEICLQLARGETTMADAAARWQVNR